MIAIGEVVEHEGVKLECVKATIACTLCFFLIEGGHCKIHDGEYNNKFNCSKHKRKDNNFVKFVELK